jgi:hypothetical protein
MDIDADCSEFEDIFLKKIKRKFVAEARDIRYTELCKHAFPCVTEAYMKDYDDLRSAEFNSLIFPHMLYHMQSL